MANVVEIILRSRDDATKSVKGLSQAISGMKDKLKPIAAISGAAFGGLIAGALKAAGAAGIQELAEVKLGQAMKTKDFFTEESHQSLIAYAAQLQTVTRYGDEQIIQAQAMISAFSDSEDQVKVLTQATLDMASAKGMDLVGAADLVAKTIGSETNALSRYGITVEGAVGSQERLISLKEGIASVFGGSAQAELDTWIGLWDSMKNVVGDVVEELGFAVIPTLKEVVTRVKDFAIVAGDWIKENRSLIGTLFAVGTAVTGVVAGLAGLGLVLPVILTGVTMLLSPIGLIAIGLAGVTAAVIYFRDEIELAGRVAWEVMKIAWDQIDTLFIQPAVEGFTWLLNSVIVPVAKKIGEAFITAGTFVYDNFVTYLVDAFNWLYGKYIWVIEKITGEDLPDTVGGTFAAIAEMAGQAWENLGVIVDDVKAKMAGGEEGGGEGTPKEEEEEDVDTKSEFHEENEANMTRISEEAENERTSIKLELSKSTRKAMEKDLAGLEKTHKASLKRIGGTIKQQVTGGLTDAIIEGRGLGQVMKNVGDTIIREIVGSLVKSIIKALALKTIMKSLSFGLFSGGGEVMGPPAPHSTGGIIRAQAGLLVPTIANSPYRVGTDTVPILATPGEAILPVSLTRALKSVLGISGGSTFAGGGMVAAGGGGVSVTIEGNVYAQDERQVDELIERISDAVRFRNVPLHATTAEDVRS